MNVKELVSTTLGFDFDFDVTEISCEGVYVSYSGGKATVGGSTVPALARAYMLLAKGVSEKRDSFEIKQSAAFSECGVMLDVSFAGVMKPEAVMRYIDYMVVHGMNLLMLYTEDTYEVKEYPYFGYQRGRYTVEELRAIDDYAALRGVELVPCIQTFGHLSKFLRYAAHSNIAENSSVLLPGEEETYKFIEACIRTCRQAFRSKRMHIGCDETHGVGFGKSFIRDGYRDHFEIFNEHVSRVVDICKKYDFHPMMWSDMYFRISDPGLEVFSIDAKVPQYAIDSMPDADMVYWDYYHDSNEFHAVNIAAHKKFNRKCIFAGGIWAWNGFAPDFKFTYNTMKPALEECVKGGIDSVFATIWAYGDINHMQALPSLAVFSEYCWRGLDCTRDDIDSVAEFITKTPRELTDAISDFFCGLIGDFNVGKLVLWSDPLINLLCYDYDLPAYEKCFMNSLKVFEKYPDAPYIEYYKALFRAVLSKTRLQISLRDKYKADDRVWLRDFADNVLPEMEKEFEKLSELHDDLWHSDNKTQGFEKLGNRYAAAISRIKYAKRQIEKYLSGEISEIEALEPETIRGEKQQFLQAEDVMHTYCFP